MSILLPVDDPDADAGGLLFSPGGKTMPPHVPKTVRLSCVSLLLTVTAALLLFSCKNDKPAETAEFFLNKARIYARQNQPQKAIIEYKNAVQLDPGNDTAYFELAENYVLLNNIGKATLAYQQAAAINPGNIPAHLRIGQIYLKTGKLLEARNAATRVLETNPQTIEAYHLLSSIQIKERNLAAAVETLKKAILVSPGDIKARLALARLYASSSRIDLAEAMYRESMALDTARREPYSELCRLYRKQKDWTKMESLLLEVIQTPGIQEIKLTDLARFYEGQKNYAAAESYFERAVDASPKSAYPLMNLAEFQTRRRDKDKAVRLMEKAVETEPGNPEVLIGLAQIYLEFSMPASALDQVEKALKRDQDNVDGLFTKARILMDQQDFNAAHTLFTRVITLDIANAKAYYYRAMCTKRMDIPVDSTQEIFRAAAGLLDEPDVFQRTQMKKDLQASLVVDPELLSSRLKLIEVYLYEKDTIKADEHLGIAFQQNPRNPRLLILLAALKILQGDLKAAQDIYTAVVTIDPSYLPGHIRLAMLYKATGQTDKAVQSYLNAYSRDPAKISILKHVSDTLIEQKQYSKALATLNELKLPQDKPSRAFIENLKGEIASHQNRPDKALEHFQASMALDQRSIAPRMNMAKLLMDRRQLEKARDLYHDVETTDPGHLPALMSLGYIYDLQNNLERAEEYYRKVLALDPKHGFAANNLAFILADTQRDTDEALRLSGIAMEQHPDNSGVLDTMGWIHYQKGSYLNAITAFEDSLAKSPDNASACFHMGMTLYRTKEFEKARSYFQKALTMDPDFKDAEIARAMLR